MKLPFILAPRSIRPRAFGLLSVVLLNGLWPMSLQATEPLVFNTTAPVNHLTGSLALEVLFAQSQILPARVKEGDKQPWLTSLRKSLLLVRPLIPEVTAPISVSVRDGKGRLLGSLNLNPPNLLPKTAYFLDGGPEEGIEFTPMAGSTGTIRGRSALEKLSDQSGAFLLAQLQGHAQVEIVTADGQWVRDIYLPQDKALSGRIVRVKSEAGYGSTVYYSGRQAALSRGQSLRFKCVNGVWFREGEMDNNAITYANNTWSGELPAEWILPGLTLQFQQGNSTGELTGLKVGAPTQLLIHTIDIGMLTPPRGEFKFANDPEAHREYFQTIPTSRLIVSQYAPIYLPEVMLPTGTLLTDFDESEGGWHTGTMRQNIGKELISHGIDNANYGINSTSGQGEKSHPYVVAQLAAHNSRGKYSNGIRVHGGSGGGGVVTLDQSLGNELSHEVGHNYGLGHYVDGFKGSVHRPADQINSTWGWDADKGRFIPNFSPVCSGKETSVEKENQPPFNERSYGLDAMAGGAPFSSFNRFTLYTPNTAVIIQRFLESKAVFDEGSPTGFRKWNASTSQMEPYRHSVEAIRKITPPVKDLSEAAFATFLTNSDLVSVAIDDGKWTREIHLPPASAANRGRVVAIEHAAANASVLFANGQQVSVDRGFKKSYTSDGKRWNEGDAAGTGPERKPQAFGVPVVTLVGYYDPLGQLRTYIYPALHGAFGFCYADDSSTLGGEDCELQVETQKGVLRFRLSNTRLGGPYMNKFHINVPEASLPRSVAVVSHGKVLDKKPITQLTEKLTVTVNGIPLASKQADSAKVVPASGAPR